MDRQKALVVLKELLQATKEIEIRAISLNPEKNGNFTLRIDCPLCERLQKVIEPVLRRENLESKKDDDTLIISG